MQPKRKGITVSLPPDMARQFERLAKAEAKNKSQLFRDMIRVYQQHLRNQEFTELQKYGARMAQERGVLTEADVEKLVFEDR